MQTRQVISNGDLREIIAMIYSEGGPVVKEAYSEYDSPTKSFLTAENLIKDVFKQSNKNKKSEYYAIYYPDTKGYVKEEKIKLDSIACPGATYRFSQKGWGLIFLHCDFRNETIIECEISVNTEKRAIRWSETYPDLKSPNLWDWKRVSKRAGKLVRLLKQRGKKLGNQ